MKKSFTLLTGICLIPLFAGAQQADQRTVVAKTLTPAPTLAGDFLSPPDTMTTGVYWYWTRDNISKEGVVKDLHAMKKAGINSAFIGNIEGYGVPRGNVKLFTDEWWDILHTAMKTAGELDIEVGMFNCPGWSQAGGPWIKPEQTMRHLVASETVVEAGKQANVKLPVPSQPSRYEELKMQFVNNEGKPSPYFQDVKTLAVPIPAGYRFNLFDAPGAKITTTNMKTPKDATPKYPVVGVPDNSPLAIKYYVPKGKESSITLRLPKPYNARSLYIYPASLRNGKGELQAKVGGKFVTVATYSIYLYHPISSLGDSPFAPVVAGFDKVTSDEYRIIFRNFAQDAAIGKILLSPSVALDTYAEKTLANMIPFNTPYTEYKWDKTPGGSDNFAAINPAKVIDISAKVKSDGTLVWDAPDIKDNDIYGDASGTEHGKPQWLILRMGMVPNETFVNPATKEGHGWEMDKLNPEVIPYHFDKFLGEILRRIPPEDRKTFRVTILDSWERGGQTFTDNFIESLKAHYGYDPTPFLPVLTGHVAGSPEKSERFLWDVRRLVAEIIGNNLLSSFNAISHKHGIKTWIENYGEWGFPGEFLLYGKHADQVGGEFWSDGYHPNAMAYMDVAASCAHIYNKPRVYAEAFTRSNNRGTHPRSLKHYADAAFAAGLTSCILHVYIQQATDTEDQGVTEWFGVEFHRKNTWFKQLDMFTAYLKRCGVMLEQGLPVSDVAYFIGEDAPVNSGPFGLPPNAAKNGISIPVLPQGYSMDYVNSDVIMNTMSVKDGCVLLPHGISYRLLVLPPMKTMRPEVLRSIERLVNDGTTLLGEAPQRSPSLQNYPEADKEVAALADKMWGDKNAKQRNYGKGKILSGMTLKEALDVLKINPDAKLDNKDFVYAHRTDGGREIYFVANRGGKRVELSPEFRVVGKQPELWNAINGERRSLPAYIWKDNSTIVPLVFEPYESMFIVFTDGGKPQSSSVAANFPAPKILTEINTPWTVTFESDKIKRGPAEPVTFEKLQSWTQNKDERIRRYSGTGVYKNVFTLDNKPKKNIYINLGKIGVMAKVKINGQYVGGAWTEPYRVNITEAVTSGENTLEVEVVNTWVNRLSGGSMESGLMGPVRIELVVSD